VLYKHIPNYLLTRQLPLLVQNCLTFRRFRAEYLLKHQNPNRQVMFGSLGAIGKAVGSVASSTAESVAFAAKHGTIASLVKV
jgi:hypothetical protein